MSFDDNIFGFCSTSHLQDGRECLDLKSLANKLILFDKFILYSPNLREVSLLLEVIGFEDTLKLLSSGILKVCCELRITGQIAQTEGMGPVLPIGHYRIAYGYAYDRKKWISDQLEKLRSSRLDKKHLKKLKSAVAGVIEDNYIQDKSDEIKSQTVQDLAYGRGIVTATVLALRRLKGVDVKPTDYSIKLHQINEQDFRVETNLGELLNLDELEVHQIVEKAVLSIGTLNLRIAEMKLHQAMSGLLEGESPLLEDKLQFIIQSLDPHKLEGSLDRILRLKSYPEIFYGVEHALDVDKLLEVRDSQELLTFRRWLKDADALSDAEILEQVNDVRLKLGVLAQSSNAKWLKFAFNSLIGLIPGGAAPAFGMSWLDTFMLEKVLPYSGVVAFLDKSYPSLFKPN